MPRKGIALTTLYRKFSGSSTWSAADAWSNTGASGMDSSGPPTAADNCILESFSGPLTIDSGAVCRSLDCQGGTGSYSNILTHTAGVTLTIGDGTAGAGNRALRLSSGMTYTLGSATTSAISFVSTAAVEQSIQVAGKATGNLTFNGVGGIWKLIDTLTTVATTTLTNGKFSINNVDSSFLKVSTSNSNTREFDRGSGTLSLSGTGTIFDASVSTNLTLSGTGKIAAMNASATNKTLQLGGKTFGVLSLASGGSGYFAIGSACSLTRIETTGGLAASVMFPGGATVTLTGTTPVPSGSSGNALTLGTTSGVSNVALTSQASCDFLAITNVTASGTVPAYAGANSTLSGTTTNWVASAPPVDGQPTASRRNGIPGVNLRQQLSGRGW